MDVVAIADAINQYGFPTLLAVGMGYFIYFIWNVGNCFSIEAEKRIFTSFFAVFCFSSAYSGTKRNGSFAPGIL